VDSEVHSKAKADSKVDFEEAKKAKEATSDLTAEADQRHARRSALSARRKDASLPTTQIKKVKLLARSSSLHIILQVHNHLRTSQYTLQSMKGLNTQASTTRVTGTTTTTIAPAISNNLNNSSSRSNAFQIRHSYTTSLATTYTAKTRRQHQRHGSCLRTATHDLLPRHPIRYRRRERFHGWQGTVPPLQQLAPERRKPKQQQAAHHHITSSNIVHIPFSMRDEPPSWNEASFSCPEFEQTRNHLLYSMDRT
jgi:hypothetical protein